MEATIILRICNSFNKYSVTLKLNLNCTDFIIILIKLLFALYVHRMVFEVENNGHSLSFRS